MSEKWTFPSSNNGEAAFPSAQGARPAAGKRPGMLLGDLRSTRNPDQLMAQAELSQRPVLTVSVSAPGMLDSMGFQPQLPRRPRSFEGAGKLQISPDKTFEFTCDDLTDEGEIGRGGFGAVNKMFHGRSSTRMAVKRIRSTVEEKEQVSKPWTKYLIQFDFVE